MAEFSLGDAVLGTAIDLTGLDQGLKDAEEKSRSGFGAIGDVIGGVLKVGLAVAAAGVAAAGAIVASGVADAREAAQLMAQTEAAIASTGGAAERTAQQIADLASRLSDAEGMSLFGDDQIQQSENLLLTFTNLKGEVFDLATAMTVDMAQALHKTPEDMALMIGKLLNSADAMSAAQRAGVSFSDEQLKLGKHLFETGRIAEYQKLVLGELNKEFGGSARAAAVADGGWTQFRARMGEAAETIGHAVLPLLNDLASFLNSRVAPAIEGAAETIAELIPQLADFASDAFAWGMNLGQEFASGLASAAATVVSVLQQIGATIAYWLAPGSPPNLLPEIDLWGQQTAQAWLDGFGAADLSAIEDLGGQIRDVLQGLVKAGDFDEAGVIPAVLGSERAIADAIASADEFGNVGEDAIRGIISAAGPAGPKVEGLVRAFFDLRRTTQDVARAQAELNRITAKYAEQIDPLSAEIQAINDQQQAIDDQIRVRDLQSEINDGKTDELTRQKDLLEIQEIGKRAELRGIERNRDAEVGAAQTRLSAAEEAQQAAQDRLKDEQAAAESLTHQNELIGQQVALLERMQQQAEAAAKAKGGGGGGGAPSISIPTPAPPDVSPVTDALDQLDRHVADTQNQVEAFFGGLSETVATAVAPAIEVLQPLITIFESAPDPITGLLDVLSAVSPTFELLRGVVEAALPPIQSIVESVFGIIGGLISEHGAQMLTDVTETWAGIQAIIDGILPPIQSVVETVLGGIATFLAAHGDEIQAVLAKAWDTIAMVVDAALKLINATVVPAFAYIASFLSAHSAEIQQILGGAWDIIRSAIDIALTLIQGIITTAMQLIQGDFSGAWATIQTTNEQVWADIQTAISGAWEIIKGLITTAIDGILTPILGMPEDVAGVGAAIINNIWDGLKAKWDEMVAWFNAKLQELRDMLPGSEPRDTSSPLYGLGAAGQATILNILEGLANAAPALPAALAEIFAEMRAAADAAAAEMGEAEGEALRQAVERQIQEATNLAANLGEQIASAINDALGGQIDLGRAEERALGQLGDFQDSIQEALDKDQQAKAKFTEDQLAAAQAKYEEMFNADPSKGQEALEWLDRRKAEILAQAATAGSLNEAQRAQLTELSAATRSQIDQAQAEADKLAETDPEKAAAFFQMRQKQIMELAKLQQEAALTTDATEKERLERRMALLRTAQAREQALFERKHQGDDASSLASLRKQIQDLIDRLETGDSTSDRTRSVISALTQALTQLSAIGGNAGGTSNWPGGWSWVGEEGPELLNLPRGAQVLPTPALGGLLAGGATAVALQRVEIDLSLNSRGLEWLERLIDARVDAKTSRAAGAGDVRRRTR